MSDQAKDPQPLNDEALDGAAGGQQLYKHEFPGAVNQQTGLRPFEPPQGPGGTVPSGELDAYGSTDDHLPG